MPEHPTEPPATAALTTRRGDHLFARVRWLDRYRRAVAIAAAAVVSPLAFVQLTAALGAEWPPFHLASLALIVGFVVWVGVETALAAVTALWETEHASLVRAGNLPVARVARNARQPPAVGGCQPTQ